MTPPRVMSGALSAEPELAPEPEPPASEPEPVPEPAPVPEPEPARDTEPVPESELQALVESVALEAARQPQRAEQRLTAALTALGARGSPGPRAGSGPHAGSGHDPGRGHDDREAYRRRWTGRLLVQRARARHYLRSLAAFEDSERALSLLRPDEDLEAHVTARNLHAVSCGYAGDLDGQLRHLTAGLKLIASAPERPLRRLAAILTNNLAVALYDLGDPGEALSLLASARADAAAADDPRVEEWVHTTAVAAASHLLLGYEGADPLAGDERAAMLESVGEWTELAVAAADRAVERGDPAANRRGATWCLGRRAQLAGETDEAVAHARRAVELTASLGEADLLARARLLLGELLLGEHRLAEAEPVLRRVVASTDRFASTTLVMTWARLADLYEQRGDLRSALDAMRHHVRCVTTARAQRTRHEAVTAAARLRHERAEEERDRWRAESEQERRAARVDPLTGIGNRRAFNDAVAELAGSGEECALALFDVDHFKAVNDTYGHLAGDEVLRRCATAMSAVVQQQLGAGTPYLFRMGGEEFAVLFPLAGRSPEQARKLVDAVRESVASAPGGGELPAITVTQSAGVALGRAAEGGTPGTALLTRADDCLYAAKRGGRNRTEGP